MAAAGAATGRAGAVANVVLLHGILASARNLRGLAQRISAARPELRVVAIDLRCHGDAGPAAPPHDLDACAADVAAVLAGLAGDSLVVGHSFGGKVALTMALQPPPSLAGVVVLDSAPGAAADAAGSTAAAAADVASVLAAIDSVPMPAPSLAAAKAQLAAAGLPGAVVAFLSTALHGSADGYRWRFDRAGVGDLLAAYGDRDLWPALERPLLPTTFVRAGASPRWSQADIARLEATASASSALALHTLAEAGHWLHIDDPDAVLAIVLAALRRAEAR